MWIIHCFDRFSGMSVLALIMHTQNMCDIEWKYAYADPAYMLLISQCIQLRGTNTQQHSYTEQPLVRHVLSQPRIKFTLHRQLKVVTLLGFQLEMMSTFILVMDLLLYMFILFWCSYDQLSDWLPNITIFNLSNYVLIII